MIRIKSIVIFVGVFIPLVLAVSLWAGTTGKIVGTVRDKDTGASLPGVNIVIRGTTMGAATNLKGEYFIINVRAGTYTLEATMVGYKKMVVSNVKVSADLTTTVNFELEPTVLELGEVVEVTAERKIVRKDVTSSQRIVGGREIQEMPVSDFDDVVVQQVGVVETNLGLSGGVHIRGGRENETAYIVDGVYTNDPFTSQRGIWLDNNAISEMSVTTGGFDAEYGQAMSGVVNVVTPEAGRDYGGMLEYTTDRPLNGTDYDNDYDNTYFSFGGPIPWSHSKAGFFLSGAYLDVGNRNPMILPTPRNDEIHPSGTAKITIRPTKAIKLTLNGNWSRRKYHAYSTQQHHRSRGKWLYECPLYRRGNSQVNLKFNHTLSKNTFYTINMGRFNTYTKYSAQNGRHYHDFRAIGPGLKWMSDPIKYGWYDQEWGTWLEGLNPDSVWLDYYKKEMYYYQDSSGTWRWVSPELHAEALNDRWFDTGHWIVDYSAPESVRYVPFDLDAYLEDVANSPNHQSDLYQGDIDRWAYPYPRDEYQQFIYNFFPRWHDRRSTHHFLDFKLESQVDKYNYLKFGVNVRKYDLEFTDIQFSNSRPYSDHYHKKPLEFAIYLQDKVEFEDLVFKPGLRLDYFDPASQRYKDYTNVELGKEEAKSRVQISPRVGISFAVGDKTVLYCSYGHFFQIPDLSEIYMDLNADLATGYPLIGDPGLPPKKTISYEIGLKHAFTPDVRGDITAYYKDVPVLLSSEQVDTYLERVGMPVQYTRMTTNDFATIKGIDVSLSKRRGIFTGKLTYSYLSAKGSGSNGREFYYYYMVEGEPRPKREYPLEFDINHTIKASLNMYLKKGYGPALWGFKPLSDLNANLQFTFMSGAPYTPVNEKGKPMEMGSKKMPSFQKTDLKVEKGFGLGGKYECSFFIDVRNLFDVENVVNIYRSTGKPDDDSYKPTRESFSSEEEWKKAVEDWYKYVKNPNNYGEPRIIKLGLRLSF